MFTSAILKATAYVSHSGYKILKPTRNRFSIVCFNVNSQVFLINFKHFCFRNLTFKTCQIVAGISITSQFLRFFINLISGGFFPIGPIVGRRAVYGRSVTLEVAHAPTAAARSRNESTEATVKSLKLKKKAVLPLDTVLNFNFNLYFFSSTFNILF